MAFGIEKDDDCRFMICNHLVKHGLSDAYDKQEAYILWLQHRNIPLPLSQVSSLLEYCNNNGGLDINQIKLIHKTLKENNFSITLQVGSHSIIHFRNC